MKKQNEIDMSEGPLLPKLILFIAPLIVTNILQITFNMADLIVVGRYIGKNALAAVGSNNALVALLVCMLIGMTMGVNVLVSRHYGAKSVKDIQETIQTSLITSLMTGIIIAILGIAFSRSILKWIHTPDDILPLASVYLKIYFCGIPFLALYNFSAAILRAVGDTRHPLYYLSIAGVLNVVLNLWFVLGFHWGVAGVAIATVISEGLSCFLILRFLVKTDADYRLELKRIRFYYKPFRELVYIGIPAGIQSSMFSISNIIIQGAINSLGAVVMAGNSAGCSLESFVFVAQDAISVAALASVSQNVGAGHFQRTRQAVWNCTFLELILCSALGVGLVFFRYPLMGIYTSDPEAIAAGALRLFILGSVYFLNGYMNMMPAALRGFGFSLLPTTISLVGICIFRMIWIGTVFTTHPTLTIIYISYPITWALTGFSHFLCYWIGSKKAYERLHHSVKDCTLLKPGMNAE